MLSFLQKIPPTASCPESTSSGKYSEMIELLGGDLKALEARHNLAQPVRAGWATPNAIESAVGAALLLASRKISLPHSRKSRQCSRKNHHHHRRLRYHRARRQHLNTHIIFRKRIPRPWTDRLQHNIHRSRIRQRWIKKLQRHDRQINIPRTLPRAQRYPRKPNPILKRRHIRLKRLWPTRQLKRNRRARIVDHRSRERDHRKRAILHVHRLILAHRIYDAQAIRPRRATENPHRQYRRDSINQTPHHPSGAFHSPPPHFAPSMPHRPAPEKPISRAVLPVHSAPQPLSFRGPLLPEESAFLSAPPRFSRRSVLFQSAGGSAPHPTR